MPSDRWPVFCSIRYPDGTGHTAMGYSLFECASKAIRWIEIDRQTFGTARKLSDEDVLDIGVGMVPDKHYRVRVGRVRAWLRSVSEPEVNGARESNDTAGCALNSGGQFLQPSLSKMVR